MKTNKLRREYIQFFKEKNHKIFPSDSLVSADSSLFFTSAGMNQFKPYFLGQAKGVDKAVSCQRCLRTGDIQQVGKTPYHHTFFEMLGNFSFGDYFKKEAIGLAWEFLTDRLKIEKEKLWVSVYQDDQEAFSVWKNKIGVSVDKIVKLDQSHNFWPANVLTDGPDGPCGPCSEVFFDQGTPCSDSCNPACDCRRFVEIWNLVFTQFDRQSDGRLEPLPQKNIDTGMGLERMAAVLQNKKSNFEIDILFPVTEEVKNILKVKGAGKESMIYSIVDHARAVVFAVADGVYPSNEERGYVVRKLLRKALWTASLLGYKESFIYRLIPLIIRLMAPAYPFLKEKAEVMQKIIKREEESFLLTLEEGKGKLDACLQELKRKGKKDLAADELFCLYDTYGFPFELTEDIARRGGFSVDSCGAEKLLNQQKKRSRAKSKFSGRVFEEGSPFLEKFQPTDFTGYNQSNISGRVLGIFSLEKNKVDWKEEKKTLKEGEQGVVILDKTPFYPESGGQLSDQGVIKTDKGKFFVEAVYKVADGTLYVHQGKVLAGVFEKKEFQAQVDKKRRQSLARAHTATHLLQAALREVLGEHVSQQGSLVGADRLRFDFTHFEALTSRQIEKVESLVNSYILEANNVGEKRNISLEDAKSEGALAFFKEKYKSKVRMIAISDYSKELCAGLHLDNTAKAGGFAVVSESSVSSGVRRLEAVVGEKFCCFIREKRNQFNDLASMLKCSPDNICLSLEQALKELKENKDKIIRLENEKISAVSEKLLTSFLEKTDKSNLLVYDFTKKGNDFDLKYCNFFKLLDLLKDKLDSFFIFLIGKSNGKVRFLSSSSQDLSKKGLSCKQFISKFKEDLSLKGGGGERLVQGAIDKIDSNLEKKIKEYFVRWEKNESS